ncbi:hypothetical protein JW824_13520 [bacterium]|nr:hypothetical protein [bacterium]
MGDLCACCSKNLRRFPISGGPWSETIGELSSMPRIEADHGFVCDECGSVICPVCAGKKASEMGVRQFVCTECGYMPLKTIYR